VLPLIAPAIFAGALLSITLSIDEFVVTFFTIGPQLTLPLYIYTQIKFGVTPEVNALATVILLGTLLVFGAGTVLFEPRRAGCVGEPADGRPACSVPGARPTTRSGSPSRLWGQSASWTDLMTAGERVEALGFASLFANDHLMPILGDADGPLLGSTGPVFEGWMTLGAWAARTTRIPLGVMVCGVGYRNVALTVKMATALGPMPSAGRAMLGLGAGWHEPEHRAFGYEVLELGDRISRFDEASRLARGMLDGKPVTQDGRWVSAHEVINDPPPVPEPDAAPDRRQRREADPPDRGPRCRHLERRGRPGDVRAQKRGPRRALRRDRSRPGFHPANRWGVQPVCIRPSREAAVEALAAILTRHGVELPQARAWAASSPLADTEEAVIGLFRAWRAAGAEEAVVDLPCPIDDETFERLAGPVRGASLAS